jgi:hypothetical protein
MKLVREHIIFEKFTEDSDPIRDMGIGFGNPVNFEEIAKKTIRRNSPSGNWTKNRDNWLNFLESLVGKKLTGKFWGEKDIISIRVKKYDSYMEGKEIYFYDSDHAESRHRVHPDETYYIL